MNGAKETVQRYFDALQQRSGWEDMLADDVVFTSLTSPNRQIRGKQQYIEGTKRFFSMIDRVELGDVIANGSKVCALTRYALKSPRGAEFWSDVAEIFDVSDGKVKALSIVFDTAPYPK